MMEQHVFKVEASKETIKTLKLRKSDASLVVRKYTITVYSAGQHKAHWLLTDIRGYGHSQHEFTVSVGRRAQTGEGVFSFSTTEGRLIKQHLTQMKEEYAWEYGKGLSTSTPASVSNTGNHYTGLPSKKSAAASPGGSLSHSAPLPPPLGHHHLHEHHYHHHHHQEPPSASVQSPLGPYVVTGSTHTVTTCTHSKLYGVHSYGNTASSDGYHVHAFTASPDGDHVHAFTASPDGDRVPQRTPWRSSDSSSVSEYTQILPSQPNFSRWKGNFY